MNFDTIDKTFIHAMRHSGVAVVRVTLGIVFLWFGALKLAGVSPVVELVTETYWFIPANLFLPILGVWELLIGIGLLFKKCLRTTLGLLWLQLAGTLSAAFLAPYVFFTGNNIFLLTMEGEFIIKNFVLIAAGLVIGGHEVGPEK
jgi:uncharacterized membrane protein YkgB